MDLNALSTVFSRFLAALKASLSEDLENDDQVNKKYLKLMNFNLNRLKFEKNSSSNNFPIIFIYLSHRIKNKKVKKQ